MKDNFCTNYFEIILIRSSHPDLFLGKGVLKICNKFTGEHPCRSAISIFSKHLFLRAPPGGYFYWMYAAGLERLTLKHDNIKLLLTINFP